MRRLGPPLVLLAVVLVQIPLFTCRHDCEDDCVPLWAYVVRHCADEGEPDHHHHHCAAPRGPGCDAPHPHPPDEAPCDGGEDHGPDDHDLVFAPLRSDDAGSEPVVDPYARLNAFGPESGVDVAPPRTVRPSRERARTAGPPGDDLALETVRLLL